MNELIAQILEIIAPFAGALLTALCGFAISYLKKRSGQIKTESDNALVTKYADMITETVTNCVVAVNQTYVDTLKKNDAFTKEAQEEAFKMCYNNIVGLLSVDAQKYIVETFGDLEIYLTTRIESLVNTSKK
jgi:hypothetical protein